MPKKGKPEAILILLLFIFLQRPSWSNTYRYAVVISSAAYSESGWKNVADSLLKKHQKNFTADIFIWSKSVNEVKSGLSAFKPDYIGFIARPVSECNSSFIVAISRLSRQLDNDPYGDAVWGIITGYDPSDALRAFSESLTVKTVLSASGNLSYEPPIQRFDQAIGMTCDSYTKTDYLFKNNQGKIYSENKRPSNEQDRIKLVSKWLNAESLDLEIADKGKINGPVDCIITGGHGNVNLWQCHYPDAGTEGYLRSSGGKLIGSPYSGTAIEINAPTPKIYWCASNCLMGNPDKKDNVVYAAFKSGHAVQMFGFVNNASSGDEFMAWGTYDRVTKSAGKYTLAEGFFLSNNNALFEIKNSTGQMNTRLVEQFIDSTVFYGDPAADVKFKDLGDSSKAYLCTITFTQNSSGAAEFRYTVTMQAHDLEFGAGYCYQFRPANILPVRIDPATVKITNNEGHKAEITDNLVIWEMLSSGEKLGKGKSKNLSWTAKIENSTNIVKQRKSLIDKNAHFRLVSNYKGSTLWIDRFQSGEFELKIIDISGKLHYYNKFTSYGSDLQPFKVDFIPSRGMYILVLNDAVHSYKKSILMVP